MKKNYFKLTPYFFFLSSLFVSVNFYAQESNVQINPSIQRYLGDISKLDRAKYFNMHASDPNDADVAKFMQDYNVGLGRSFWGPFSYAKWKTGEVGVYPEYKDGNSNVRAVTKNMIATEHPKSAFKDGLDLQLAASWAAEYYKDFVADGDAPEYFELMNEPFVHSDDFYDGWSASENERIVTQMCEFYNEVGKSIHADPALANMKVIGYSAAWASPELWDFGHWDSYMKKFMDIAGDNMDAFATHLYDGINVTGQNSYRSGSNGEAILDLIENYSFIKWGLVKPHAISEFGGIEKGYGDDFSFIANVQSLKAINHLLFNLLDREDRLSISIPFIGDKGKWHITEANNYQPYGAVLFVPENIGSPIDNNTVWEYTERIHFYELWKEFKGNRVYIKSDNPDIQTHAFTEGNKLYVALSNLDSSTQTVNLEMLSNQSNIESVKIKSLKIYDQTLPDFVISDVTTAPNSIDLIADETVTLEYTLTTPVVFDNAIRSTSYFTSNHLEAINANTAINYSFNGVTEGEGIATLRMSIGRKHDVSKKPIIKVNNSTIEVPSNWQGYDQANRDDFFGMIEIPFSANLLRADNTVTVEFPDTGGHLSSLVLNVAKYDKSENTLSVKAISETCRNSNNGQITITPYGANSYKAHLKGVEKDENIDFSAKHTIKDLKAGTYSLVITVPSEPDFKEEYNLEITEPEDLVVQSKIDDFSKKISLKLKGSTSYKINLNGFSFTTSKNSISLPLENGENKIEVKGDTDCQGVYSEDFLIGSEIIGYPNPFNSQFNIDLGVDPSNNAKIQIYSSVGTLVYSNEHNVKQGKIKLDTSFLNNGLYLLSVKTENSIKNIKIIKQ